MDSNYQRLYANQSLPKIKTNTQDYTQGSGPYDDDSTSSAGSSSGSSGYLDSSQADQENVVPSLSNRLAQEMHAKRKEERIKLINTNRNLLPDQYDNLFRHPVIVEEESHDEPENRRLTDVQEESSDQQRQPRCVDNTYLVGNNNSGSSNKQQERGKLYCSTKSVLNRNKAMEQWRKNRQQTKSRDNRPAFKVYHVDPRDFDFVIRNTAPVMGPPQPQSKQSLHQLSQIKPSESALHITMIAKGVAGFKTSSPKATGPSTSRLASSKAEHHPPFYFGLKNPQPAQSKFMFAASLGNNTAQKKAAATTLPSSAKSSAKQADSAEFVKPKPPPPTASSKPPVYSVAKSSVGSVKTSTTLKPPKPSANLSKPDLSKNSRSANNSQASSSSRSSSNQSSRANSTKNDSSASSSNNNTQTARPSENIQDNVAMEDLTSRLNSVAVTLEKLPEEESSHQAHMEEAEETKEGRLSNETRVIVMEDEPEPEPEDPRATDLAFDFESVPLESRDVKYYRSLVINRTKLLNDYSSKWLSLCNSQDQEPGGAPEDVQGEIRSACGLAQLLIDERFDQFSELIDQCEASSKRQHHLQSTADEEQEDVKVVLCSDLQGFWDMVEYQVRDVEKKFAYLKLLKEHNYIADNIPLQLLNPTVPKAAPAKKKFIKPFTSTQKQSRSIQKQDSTDTGDETSKSPAKSNGAKASAFRAQLARLKATRLLEKKSGKASSTEDILTVDFVMQKRKSVSSDDVTELAQQAGGRKSTARKSIKLTATPRVLADLPENENPGDQSPKRYNLRSRPSQVTKFESPMTTSVSKPSRKSKRVSLFPKPEVFEFESAASAAAVADEQSTIVHMDDQQATDKDRLWVAPPPVELLSNMASPMMAAFKEEEGAHHRQSMSSTPLLHNHFQSRARKSLGLTLNPIDVAKSPLLKLAKISSHGKRVSLSAHNNTSRQF